MRRPDRDRLGLYSPSNRGSRALHQTTRSAGGAGKFRAPGRAGGGAFPLTSRSRLEGKLRSHPGGNRGGGRSAFLLHPAVQDSNGLNAANAERHSGISVSLSERKRNSSRQEGSIRKAQRRMVSKELFPQFEPELAPAG